VDLPGTYSLLTASVEEEVARDFLLFANPDVVIVVVDATALERNLNLVLQILQVTPRVVVALNLMDEAKRKGIHVDHRQLARALGVPVVPIVARTGEGIGYLMQAVEDVAAGRLKPQPYRMALDPEVQAAVDALVPLIRETRRGQPPKKGLAGTPSLRGRRFCAGPGNCGKGWPRPSGTGWCRAFTTKRPALPSASSGPKALERRRGRSASTAS